jgi:hypothetical protein
MTSPALSATQLLAQIGWRNPSDISIEEIAWSCGMIVKYAPMRGSDVRILMRGNETIITINQNITYQPKINFVLAHELGHGHLHRQLSLFDDNEKSLSEWYARGPQEKEANLFAAELLMPAEPFSRKVKSKKLELSLIEDLAGHFGASKTATFLRYRDLGEFPVMIIFIENGIIKWKSGSIDFPYQWLTLGEKVPAFTVAGDLFYRDVEEKKPARVNAIEWFPEDYNCQRDENAKLWEQCFPSTKNSLLTCLWTA